MFRLGFINRDGRHIDAIACGDHDKDIVCEFGSNWITWRPYTASATTFKELMTIIDLVQRGKLVSDYHFKDAETD